MNLNKPIETKQKYLVICLVRPEITSIKAVEIVNTMLQQFDADIKSQETYNYPLAYKINKNDRAHFVATTVVMEKDVVGLLLKRISEKESFLRAFITKNLNMDISENSAKNYSANTTKRGRILIQKKLPRQKRRELAREIKTRRSIGLMRCCNYFA